MSGLPTYRRWDEVPGHLKTKTQLAKEGLRPAKDQKPAAYKTDWYGKSPDYALYDVAAAVPKRVPTEAQLAAIEKAKAASLAARTCRGCGYVEELGPRYRGKVYVHKKSGLCDNCLNRELRRQQIAHDREQAILWAKDALAAPLGDILILDSETTGLYGEIIELAVIDLAGRVLYNGRFNPLEEIEPGAAEIHGLTAEALANEPRWSEEYGRIKAILEAAHGVIIYNASFDCDRLSYTCGRHGCPEPDFRAKCLMRWYAQFVGDWRGRRGYRWQRLPGGDHTAVGDCRAALDVLRRMAEGGESAEGGET